jgi:ABC-2 type transport system ATP-binding protein
MEVLLVDAAQIGQAAEVVRRHVEPKAEVTPSEVESAIRFRTAKSEAELSGLLAALVAAGVTVAQFREIQTDLEEAFMSVARSDDADLPVVEEAE